MKSQHGPLASAALTALPTRATKITAQPLRLLLWRRLLLQLPISYRTCQCGRQLHVLGHHREACASWGEEVFRPRVRCSADVWGGWGSGGDDETAEILCALAKARAETMPLRQNRSEAAWLRRGSAVLACSAARGFSMSLLEQRLALGTGSICASAAVRSFSVVPSSVDSLFAEERVDTCKIFMERTCAGWCHSCSRRLAFW